MDLRTLDYYNNHAAEIADRYESVNSPVVQYFSFAFGPGARVLDVGVGSGRDLASLLSSSYNAYGVEPSEQLRSLAHVNQYLPISRS